MTDLEAQLDEDDDQGKRVSSAMVIMRFVTVCPMSWLHSRLPRNTMYMLVYVNDWLAIFKSL